MGDVVVAVATIICGTLVAIVLMIYKGDDDDF